MCEWTEAESGTSRTDDDTIPWVWVTQCTRWYEFLCWRLFVFAMHVMKWWTEFARICCSSRSARTRKGGWNHTEIFNGRVPQSSKRVFFVRVGLIADNFLPFSFSQWWCTLPCVSQSSRLFQSNYLFIVPTSEGYKTFPWMTANLSSWGALKCIYCLFCCTAVAHNASQ